MHHQSNSQEKISTQLHIDGLYGWLVHPTTLSTCAAKFIFLPFLLRLLKRWFGPDTVTEGAVLRRRFEQDKRRRELEADAAKIRG